MVKRLRFCWTAVKHLALISTMLLMALGFWLHGAERSLAFAKPWIEGALNSPDAPYTASIGEVSVDWRNVALLGKIRITNVTLAKRGGNAFAQFPEIFVTIDPIGFLPKRHLLHKVILRAPSLYMARSVDGALELGIEDAHERMPVSELQAFLAGGESLGAAMPPELPFHDFIIEQAKLTFADAKTSTSIISTPFSFHLRRTRGSFEASMAMPFTVDEVPVKLAASLRLVKGSADHTLGIQFSNLPTGLACMAGVCDESRRLDAAVSGAASLRLAKDFSLHEFTLNLSTPSATLHAPEWFAQTLKLQQAQLALEGDWSRMQFSVTRAFAQLEDTTVEGSITAHKAEDGWYAQVNGACGKLDVTKLYKYWPLTMAPGSRAWVTSKMKAGYAQSGTLKLHLTPAEFVAENFSDGAVDAVADARDITFEYLPGFPLVEHMDGIAHFTGTTVKVESSNGSLLSGTTISKAVLWVPDLNNPHIPMETTTVVRAPAADAARLLAIKYFTFDDALGLDPATIRGTVDTTMKLKFNAFSDRPGEDPNTIHLEAVDYDIATTLTDVAQPNLLSGYDVRALTSELTANTKGFSLTGALTLGESGSNGFALRQKTGEPLILEVKGRPATGSAGADTPNDFTLTYQSGDIPAITLRGARVDASVSYGGSEHGLLRDFPAMRLDVDVGELLLSKTEPLRDVVGKLICNRTLCESARFKAKTSQGDVVASIGYNTGRKFLLTASDAGSFLKALDISERMTKGTLELWGDYDDKKTPPQFNGRLLIKDFTLKNSQILGRILSIGSLTGLSNALTGNGIAFNKMVTDITSQAGLISLAKGAANGAAIGITVSGTVDTNTSKLNLKGVVVPAYALNSILGNIPIIGLITGGEGEGLIAFNYSVNGTYREPDVGVNPLSGLTPGFLRGIFSIFDDDSTEPKQYKALSDKPVGENKTSNVRKR